jgi:hypothetical protein
MKILREYHEEHEGFWLGHVSIDPDCVWCSFTRDGECLGSVKLSTEVDWTRAVLLRH